MEPERFRSQGEGEAIAEETSEVGLESKGAQTKSTEMTQAGGGGHASQAS